MNYFISVLGKGNLGLAVIGSTAGGDFSFSLCGLSFHLLPVFTLHGGGDVYNENKSRTKAVQEEARQ